MERATAFDCTDQAKLEATATIGLYIVYSILANPRDTYSLYAYPPDIASRILNVALW